MKHIFRIVYTMLIVLIIFGAAGCSPQRLWAPKPYNETQFLMDTIIEITAYGKNNETAVKQAFAEFKKIQDISDRFEPNSQLSQINQMAGISPVQVDHDLIRMINDSIEISKKTEGAFDITIGPLSELWGIGHKNDFVPTQAEIDELLPLVDYRQIQVDTAQDTVYLPKKGMKLDLGGVAKDYALNRAVEVLKNAGITSALVNAGGDIQVIGDKPDGTPWRIGVQDPRSSDKVAAKVTMSRWNMLQTSGDYQRYFIKDAIRYSHILNPKTGRQPSEVASVTLVYTSSDIQGDIASSGFLVLGVEKGMKALQQFPGVEGIFVTTEGKTIVTPGLQDSVEF